MAIVSAAADGEDGDEPETDKEVEPTSTVPDTAVSAAAMIIDTSKVYADLVRQLKAGPAFQVAKLIEDQDLFGTKRIVADLQKSMLSDAFVSYTAGLRAMDQLAGEKLSYLKATAALSESIGGSDTLAAWRTSLQVKSFMTDIFKGPSFHEIASVAGAAQDLRKSLGFTVRQQVYLTDWLAQVDDGRRLLSGISSSPLSLYRDYLGGLGTSPTRFQLNSSLHAGLGANGLLGADALSSQSVLDDADLEMEVADRVDDLLTPQEAGRLDVVADLRRALETVDAKVIEMLDGGWHVIKQAPPAAAEMVAQCAVEAIDRALRAAAPDSEVEAWLPVSGRPAKEWRSDTGRLTRAIRIRYIMRGHKDEAKIASTYVDSLIALQTQATGRAQAIKHASEGGLGLARCALITAENVLTLIFIIGRD